MPTFDIPTMFLMSSLMAAAMSIVLYAAHRSYPAEIQGLRHWALASMAVVMVGPLFASSHWLPEWLALSLANAVLFGCNGLLVVGMQRFYEQAPNWRLLLTIGAGGFAALFWWLVISPDFLNRVAVSSCVIFLFYCLQLNVIWRHGERHLSTAFFVFLLTLQTLIIFARGISALLMPDQSVTLFNTSFIQRLYLYTNTFMALMLTVAFMTLATRRLQTLLEARSNIDPLTKVLNRRGFEQAYATELKRMKRLSQPISLMGIDIDHFKQVNDRFGHAVGDKVLVHIAQMINSVLRDTDYVARFGGEEFIILLPATTMSAAKAIAGRIQLSLRQAEQEQLPLYTVSIGIVCQYYPDSSLSDMLAAADDALYRAKAAGRNRIELALDPLESRIA